METRHDVFSAGERSSTASAVPSSSSRSSWPSPPASLASQVTGALSAGGWTDPDSESAAVAQRLEDEFGAGGGAIVALFRGRRAGDDARSDEFQAEIAASLDRLVADDRVDGVVGWAETRDDRFISTDGTSAYVVVRLAITDEAAVDEMHELRALIDQPDRR